MNPKQMNRLGIPEGPAIGLTGEWIRQWIAAGNDSASIETELAAVIADPASYLDHPEKGALARELYSPAFSQRSKPAPWRQWGADIDSAAIEQLANACSLSIASAGALMPDAHVGYGLPIGGVLATENAVIPYAVGVDIACRMRLSVYDRPASTLAGQKNRLANILEDETRFGMGAAFEKRRHHDVLDEDWSVSPITHRYKDKAWQQLGTSGSGNHFVEFGELTVDKETLGMPPGCYLALLSHSGSRGTGALVCNYYSRLAMDRHAKLPKELRQLAWLDMETEAGQEYWNAMNLMGRYAAANHELIHRHIAKKVGASLLLEVENHHNFAWKETHSIEGATKEVIVHRKGATPAGPGVLGIIPGSMASPGFLVSGKGHPDSLHSASHGAGRVMSRKQALQSFAWGNVKRELASAGVEVLSAGLDEVPGVYKDIHAVIAAQTDLVDVLARFDPKLVKMSPAGEKPED
ncbi:MAG: RtcB family protein [Verrucomicrobiales bacterium]